MQGFCDLRPWPYRCPQYYTTVEDFRSSGQFKRFQPYASVVRTVRTTTFAAKHECTFISISGIYSTFRNVPPTVPLCQLQKTRRGSYRSCCCTMQQESETAAGNGKQFSCCRSTNAVKCALWNKDWNHKYGTTMFFFLLRAKCDALLWIIYYLSAVFNFSCVPAELVCATWCIADALLRKICKTQMYAFIVQYI